jgi:hypothetical protein
MSNVVEELEERLNVENLEFIMYEPNERRERRARCAFVETSEIMIWQESLITKGTQ